MELDWSIIGNYLPFLITGAGTTLAITVVATLIAIVLGLVLALARISGRRLLSWPAYAYIEFGIGPFGEPLQGGLQIEGHRRQDKRSAEDDPALEAAARAVVAVDDNVEAKQLDKGDHQPHRGLDDQALADGPRPGPLLHLLHDSLRRSTLTTTRPAQ
jgi:hypothetical protein